MIKFNTFEPYYQAFALLLDSFLFSFYPDLTQRTG